MTKNKRGLSGVMEVGITYALALHSFEPTSSTCLSFRAGEIIKTLNKDNSGWWDGELSGRRGWFPSNYVEVYLGDETKIEEREELRNHVKESSKRDSGRDGVVESIQNAISLLQGAVEANRIPHFQPSTAW